MIEQIIFITITAVTFGAAGYYFGLKKKPEKVEKNPENCVSEDEIASKIMAKSVLDLSDIMVYDVMNHRKNLFSMNIDSPIENIIEKIKDCPFSRIPLYREAPDNIVGVLHVKQLLKEIVSSEDINDVDISRLMVQPWFVLETTNLLHQLRLFRERREHFAIVVDEYGDLMGIVTLEDVIEEIVGDINDEYDEGHIDMVGIKKIGDRNYIIDGDVPIRDLNRKHGWSLCDDNAVTLAGYLMDMTRTIPEQGQKFIFEEFEFKIIKRHKNQLKRIRVRPQKKED